MVLMAYNQMTATQLRSTVRQITDLDSDDLPDGLLNLYIRDGYYRILDLEKRWSFLETSFNFSTVTDVKQYAISGFTVDPISEVVSIVDNTRTGYRLDMVGYDMAEQTYSGSYDTSGEPLFYAVWNGNINIYPKPNNARLLTCRGYREPIDWITNDGNVDAPASLHFPLVYYAVARVYQQMEDTTMATIYKQSFDEGVALARKKLTQPTSHGQLIMAHGQTRNRPTMQGWLKSLGSTLGQ
jgi:hypothetical protein